MVVIAADADVGAGVEAGVGAEAGAEAGAAGVAAGVAGADAYCRTSSVARRSQVHQAWYPGDR